MTTPMTTTNNQPGEIDLDKLEAFWKSAKEERALPCTDPDQILSLITLARSAPPAGAGGDVEPERMSTDEAREYLVKFMEQHFTDKTFHRYIRGQISGSGPLAGDFAWQMARALRIIEARAAHPIGHAGATVAVEQIADVILHLIGDMVMDWHAGPTGDPEEDAFHSDNEERNVLIDLVNKALDAKRGTHAAATVAADWQPMTTAPKDGTMVRLLVNFSDNATEDTSEPCVTIGANNFDHDGIDEWKLAGWNWQQDCFTEGVGAPVHWMPLLDATPASPATGASIDTLVEELALRHVAPGWKQMAAVLEKQNDYRQTEQFQRLRAFAIELLALQRQGSGEPVAVVDEGDNGLFIDFIYGPDGSPLKRGDKLYASPISAHGAQQERCQHCDGTGDVHRADGEWMGECACETGKDVTLQRLKIAAERVQQENEELRAKLAALATAPHDQAARAAVPDGWKLVPIEPTTEMLDLGHHKIDFDRTDQNTAHLNHPSQTDPEGVGTSIEQDMRDAWAAMLAAAPSAAAQDEHYDDYAVGEFARLMKEKMARSRAKGRSGWDDPKQCSVAYLQRLFHEQVQKGDPIDVANLCMMLYHYQASTTPDFDTWAASPYTKVLQDSIREDYTPKLAAQVAQDGGHEGGAV